MISAATNPVICTYLLHFPFCVLEVFSVIVFWRRTISMLSRTSKFRGILSMIRIVLEADSWFADMRFGPPHTPALMCRTKPIVLMWRTR